MITFLRSNTKGKASAESFFLSKHYQMHNVARLSHLESLGLPINGKSVMEFGAGIGDHTFYYLTKGCRMVTTDVRSELVVPMGRISYPKISRTRLRQFLVMDAGQPGNGFTMF